MQTPPMEELTQRIILATVVALTLAPPVHARPHPPNRPEGRYYTDLSGRHITRPMRADHNPLEPPHTAATAPGALASTTPGHAPIMAA